MKKPSQAELRAEALNAEMDVRIAISKANPETREGRRELARILDEDPWAVHLVAEALRSGHRRRGLPEDLLHRQLSGMVLLRYRFEGCKRGSLKRIPGEVAERCGVSKRVVAAALRKYPITPHTV